MNLRRFIISLTVASYLRSGPILQTVKPNIVSLTLDPLSFVQIIVILCLLAKCLARKNVLASTPPENLKSFPVGKNSETKRIFIFCFFFADSSRKNEENFGGQVV